MNNGKISPHQFMIMVISTFIGTSVLLIPRSLASDAKQDAWIAAILGAAVALLLVKFYNNLGEQFGAMTLVEYIKKLLGPWLGSLVAFTFVLFLFVNSIDLLWVIGSFIVTQLMPETPFVVINTLFMVVVIIGSRLGLEVIARAGEILFPWAVGGLILLLLFALPGAEFKYLQPVLENGIKPIIQTAVSYQSFNSLTLVALLMIFPSKLSNLQEGKKAFFRGTLTAGIMVFFLTIVNILVLGVESVERNVYPSYALAKKINIGNIIERMEAVIGMVWAVTVFFKTILYFNGAVVGFAQTLEFKDHRPFILPFGLLVIILSIIVYPDMPSAEVWESTTWVSYVLTNGFILPLLLIIIRKFNRK